MSHYGTCIVSGRVSLWYVSQFDTYSLPCNIRLIMRRVCLRTFTATAPADGTSRRRSVIHQPTAVGDTPADGTSRRRSVIHQPTAPAYLIKSTMALICFDAARCKPLTLEHENSALKYVFSYFVLKYGASLLPPDTTK